MEWIGIAWVLVVSGEMHGNGAFWIWDGVSVCGGGFSSSIRSGLRSTESRTKGKGYSVLSPSVLAFPRHTEESLSSSALRFERYCGASME